LVVLVDLVLFFLAPSPFVCTLLTVAGTFGVAVTFASPADLPAIDQLCSAYHTQLQELKEGEEIPAEYPTKKKKKKKKKNQKLARHRKR
jgi:hypothetical protein